MSDRSRKIDCDPDLQPSDAQASLRPEHGNTDCDPDLQPSDAQASLRPEHGNTVNIYGGIFTTAIFGPQTITRHIEVNRIEHATIIHNYHYHFHGGGEIKKRASSLENHLEDSKIRSMAAREDEDTDWTFLGHNISINNMQPLCETGRTRVYRGKQTLRVREKVVTRDLAVKIFRIVREDSRMAKTYVEEVKNMLNLATHQNVVQFVHCDKVEPSMHEHYIAMTLCHKTTLAGINVDKITYEQRKKILLQICHGLYHIHMGERTTGERRPIAHLDLKPSNILFSRNGKKVVVSDFGLSKGVELGKTSNTIQPSSTKYGGTEGWMAAEMFINAKNPKELTPEGYLKADIFSLGLLGVYILCGKHPFAPSNTDGLTARRIMRGCQDNIEDKKVPSFSTLEEDAPEKEDRKCEKDALAVDLCKTMLSHEPEKRPTIKEVLGHCMFWTYRKQTDFFCTVYCQYFGDAEVSSHRKKHGTEKQKLAYMPLSRSSGLPNDPDSVEKAAKKSLCEDFDETRILTDKEKKIKKKIHDVITDCWMGRIKEVERKMKTNFCAQFQNEKAYPYYSLRELLRCIRNRLSHVHDPEQEYRFTEFLSVAFPKLIPFIYEMMDQKDPLGLNPLHKKIYQEIAKKEDIDVSGILDQYRD